MSVRLTVLAVCLLYLGCGGTPAPTVVDTEPLSVEDWKNMDDMTLKYDPSTFDRLKEADPKLQDEKAWDQFMRTIVVPQRKIDIPPRKYDN